ncbi:Rieske (2Fe-2S) protein [Streptomyces sp. NPDC101393]|uniref:Rieske (2Fe-2S) protein n=1 Tax=Streptomyces sp. NPDC101393 TaxID=3366141 RepID=UPI0038235AEB
MARQAAPERTGDTDGTAGAAAGAGAADGPDHVAGAGTSRRAVVAAVGAAGLTAALAACGGMEEGGGKAAAPQKSGPKGAGEAGSEAGGGSDTGGGSEAGGEAGAGGGLAKTAEIPQGGGKIFKAEKVVVTQPQDGEFKAFSAICTHAGCVVGEISGGTINCLCHGSKFDITDGSVKDGPATSALAPAKVNVKGDSVTLG